MPVVVVVVVFVSPSVVRVSPPLSPDHVVGLVVAGAPGAAGFLLSPCPSWSPRSVVVASSLLCSAEALSLSVPGVVLDEGLVLGRVVVRGGSLARSLSLSLSLSLPSSLLLSRACRFSAARCPGATAQPNH